MNAKFRNVASAKQNKVQGADNKSRDTRHVVAGSVNKSQLFFKDVIPRVVES